MKFKVESWEDLYGKKIHVLKDGIWKEAYVTEDGLIYTGRTLIMEELNIKNQK